MYKTILHATDLSETHFDLCEQAVRVATQFNARLYLIYVIESSAALQLARSLMEQAPMDVLTLRTRR
mgnify:CR=1 FL=1